jgi:molybdate transport system substrate-binding protein
MHTGRRRFFQRSTRAAALLVATWRAAGLGAAPPESNAVLVFAASSLAHVLDKLAQHWAGGSPALRFSFAASSTLARQIEQGAPAHLFICADEAWLDYLEQRNLIDSASRRVVATNRLVVVQPGQRAALAPPESVDALRLALNLDVAGAPRIVTGDPAHVPLGRYARAALTQLGLWQQASARLVHADNARSALAFVESGEATAGIVYASDALLSTKVRVAARFPAHSHAPIRYGVALASGAPPAAREVLKRLFGTQAQGVFREAGFGAG